MLLIAIIIATIILILAKLRNYVIPIPIILTIVGLFVALVGAFWDFGAKKYLEDIFKHGIHFSENDMVYINKQQFLLTVIYLGIGGLYALAGFLLYYIFL